MENKVILVGGFHEVIELCELCDKKIVGLIDNNLKGKYFGCDVIGEDKDASDLYKDFKDIPLIITPDIPRIRAKLVAYYSKIGFNFSSLISPEAIISNSAKIGNGVIIQSFVNVSAAVTVGNFVKLNTCANVMHDSFLGDYVTVAPNAVILGRVKVYDLSYVGANATILPDVTVDKKVMVGAGSVVTKYVAPECTVVGIPARKIDRE